MANRFKSDGPTKEIAKGLRKEGASVEYFKARTGRGNEGRWDLIVGFSGRDFMFEVKKPGEKLKPAQIKFHASWKGSKIHVITSLTEALIIIGLVV